jgi:hypothetical protein
MNENTFDEFKPKARPDLDQSDVDRDAKRLAEEYLAERDPHQVIAMAATEAIVTIVGMEHDGSNYYPVTQVIRVEFDRPGDLAAWLNSKTNFLAEQELNSAAKFRSCGHLMVTVGSCDEPTCPSYAGDAAVDQFREMDQEK